MIDRKDRSIPTWYRQSTFLDFRDQYNRENHFPLLFIGSGMSIRAGLPNWRELLYGLAGHHDAAAPEHRILGQVVERLRTAHSDQTKLYETGSFIEESFMADIGAEGWRQTLQRLIDPPDLQAGDSKVHRSIARLRWRRIITTNYDALLERAVKIHNPTRSVKVVHPGTQAFMNAMEHDDEDYILKIHGDIDDPRSSLVLSRHSFEDLYRRDNQDFRQAMSTVLNSPSVILFLGYSHEDQYVRQLFDDELYRHFRSKIFTLVPREGKGSEFDARLETLKNDLQIHFITYSPDYEHQELLEFLDYFADGDSSACDAKYAELATARTPTVIMLHCGGTIGSVPEVVNETDAQLGVVRKYSRYDPGLKAFSDKLLNWYHDSYNTGDSFQPEILWEILPPNEQMFSENATPTLWNQLRQRVERILYKYFQAPVVHTAGAYSTERRLRELYDEEYDQYERFPEPGMSELTEKRFRRDFTNRYIMGIVVLFGTDTMAFAATSLGLSIQHLPCPIIITGANHPPDEKTAGQFHATSDAWANLMSSLYFLQCFGHRLTEVLVCFGGTIHNSANLRKRATEIIPSGRPGEATRYTEPFSFRNLSLSGQYMFKLIDGIFCNNYYPNPVKYAEMVDGEFDEFANLRHIRFDALAEVPRKQPKGQEFSDRVVYVDVSPCFPPIDVETMTKHGTAAILVQGYPSGTYPSESTFAKFLRDAYAAGIPVVLVSRYGTLASQQVYAVSDVVMRQNHILPLYEIIAETALPLLSLVVSALPLDEWNRPGDPADVIKRRVGLLRKGVHSIFTNRPNILQKELESVADKDTMSKDLMKIQELKAANRTERRVLTEAKWSLFPTKTKIDSLHDGGGDDYTERFVLMARSDLLAILDEFSGAFEKAEAGPDGLETLFTTGFGIGERMWESIKKKAANSPKWRDVQPLPSGEDRFFRLDGTSQERRRARAEEVAGKICEVIELAGLAQTLPPRVVTNAGGGATSRARLTPGSVTLTVTFNRYQAGPRGDERYAITTFSDDEREFFLQMSDGCPEGTDVGQHSAALQELYEKLLRTTWMQATRTVDWFLLGLFKGVACELAGFLGIDRQGPRDVRKRMKCMVESSQEDHLTVSYRYFESWSAHVTQHSTQPRA
jgi:L-asparaginase/Glu-tRNA(Gln) amidotransferase subunit D